jgi:predicted nucleotidyltransferase
MRLEELRHNYRDAILTLAARYKAENVRVFGSVARGEAHSASDIDILVHFKPGASLLDEAGLDNELKQLLGGRVDVVGDDVLRDEFRSFILSDAVPL